MGRRKKTDETISLIEEENPEIQPEETMPAEPVQEPIQEVESEPEPEPEPVKPSASGPSADISKELLPIFSNRTRTAVPTLISYRPAGATSVKHVIVDLDADAIEAGWHKFREIYPSGSAEDYLLRVYGITRSEIPRMYRAVATVSLL